MVCFTVGCKVYIGVLCVNVIKLTTGDLADFTLP